ncbi:ABC transporter permease [Candidatus Poribacteria bacterium]|nr:ABC transporter permease [Candidatus Poribacteria bacterium]
MSTGYWILAILLVLPTALFPRSAFTFLRAFVPLFLRKLPSALATLLFVATLVFALTKAAGGETSWGEGRVDEAVRQNMIRQWGLDQPVWKQYLLHMAKIVQLDSMPSRMQRNKTMRTILRENLPDSVALGTRALILAIVLGMPIGVICAVRHNRWIDQFGSVLALVGVSVPSFILASLAVYFLARKWGLFPATDWLHPLHLWIPGACLGAFPFAAILRLTRASMLEALREDYVRTARAKGLAEWKVIVRHALRNSLSSVISYIGPVVAGLLLGSLVVERIFAIPGLGNFFVTTVNNRDMPLILGLTVFYSALLVFMNLVVDSLYPVLNPRLREA